MKIKKYFKYLLFLTALLIGLSASAHAITAVTPAKSAINPISDTLYIVDNSVPQIKIYAKSATIPYEWKGTVAGTIPLPAGSKCYGLAVSPNGDTLYISISNGKNSAVQAHGLTPSTGIPTGTVNEMTGAYWASASSPAGMAVGGNNRLFVADQGIGRMLIFDTLNDTYVKAVITNLAGKTNLYDIAVTSTSATSYKVYLSRKVSAGEIYVFTYGDVNDTVVYEKVINTDLTYPTYLKFSNDRLYAAVNGYDDVVVKAYNTSDESLVGNVTCDVSGSYGWNAFDVTRDGSKVVFKKAQDAGENTTKIYRINTSSIPGAGTEITSAIKADGLSVDNNGEYAGLSNSPDGNFEDYSIYAGNQYPNNPTNLVQYAHDGTTVLQKGEETDNNTVIVEFTVIDPDGDEIIPSAGYRIAETMDPPTRISIDPVPSGTTVRITFDGLADGAYEWMAVADDGNLMVPTTPYGGDGLGNGGTGPADFVINTGGGEFQVTETYPTNNETDVALNAPVTIKFNRAVDTSTFSMNITPNVNFDGIIWTEGNTRASLPHAGELFTVGTEYTFDVGAQSTLAETLTGTTQFTFTASTDPSKLAPYIINTTPVESSTDVTLNQEVIITFNQDINPATFTYSINPDPTGWRAAEWNSPTQVTLVHDTPFAIDTLYEFDVTAADGANGHALIPGTQPNPFTFETGSTAGDPIVNIEITRDGDDPGSGITITWDTIPPGLGVDVYKLTCPTDTDGNYTSYFTTAAADWTLEQANVTIGSITIQNQVGQGTAEYYKIIPTGNTLQDSDLETNVAGKFDIAVGTEIERFFISSPLELSDTTLENVIGNQAADTDMIMSFDIGKNVTEGSIFSGGVWDTYPGATGPITDIEIGYTYGYFTMTSRFITLVGMVREADYDRTLDGGASMPANWMANPYPIPVDIVNAGLNASSYAPSPTVAAMAYHFDANADTIGGVDGVAVHTESATWLDGTLAAPTTLQLIPGKGYMLTEPVQSSINWNMVRPY
ncbi:MAG: Ig-like domain-containing protein [Candidatus Margulisiibacteriota bacterium]|nr:Ig-like domain-containing protein [Candidatus Margulisiibacteriota bacterium]